jgi:hypothetical protein
MSRIPGKVSEKLKYLEKLDEKEFPYLIADILSHFYHHTDIRIMDGTGDGKRDIHSINKYDKKAITQCKFHRDLNQTSGSSETDEIVIALSKFNCDSGIFATSGKISPQSKREYLDNYSKYELDWIDGAKIVEIVLDNSLLRKIWFDGNYIHFTCNSISLPFVLRELPDDKYFQLDDLSIDLNLSSDINYSIKNEIFKQKQFYSYREVDLIHQTYFLGYIAAFNIKFSGNIGINTIDNVKVNLLQALRDKAKIKRESVLAVRFGIPCIDDFSEKQFHESSQTFNLPVVSETFMISGKEILSEKDWLVSPGEEWDSPEEIRMSQLSNYCFYNSELNSTLYIYYTCSPEQENNLDSILNLETEKIIWSKSLFITAESEKIETFINSLNKKDAPDKVYEFGPRGKLACWFHPKPQLYPRALQEFKDSIYYKPFENKKGRIRKTAKELQETNWEVASKVAAINNENPFPDKIEATFGIVDILETYSQIPSPILPSKRQLIFITIFSLSYRKQKRSIEKEVDRLHDELSSSLNVLGLTFRFEENEKGLIFLICEWDAKHEQTLSTSANITRLTEELKSVSENIENIVKNRFKEAQKVTGEYWFETFEIFLLPPTELKGLLPKK